MSSKNWRCPSCKRVLEKGALDGVGPQTKVLGATTCPKCGQQVELADVHDGKYDWTEPVELVEETVQKMVSTLRDIQFIASKLGAGEENAIIASRVSQLYLSVVANEKTFRRHSDSLLGTQGSAWSYETAEWHFKELTGKEGPFVLRSEWRALSEEERQCVRMRLTKVVEDGVSSIQGVLRGLQPLREQQRRSKDEAKERQERERRQEREKKGETRPRGVQRLPRRLRAAIYYFLIAVFVGLIPALIVYWIYWIFK
jgi:hypothetical protein